MRDQRDTQPTRQPRPLSAWQRFLHLRRFGRTHLAVAWRLTENPPVCRRQPASGKAP